MITDGEADRSPGTLVSGRYRMHELVGSGGMGTVWRATDELLGREVAIKQVRLDLQPPAEAAMSRERTMREARIAAALHHPNVVTIFDVVIDGGEPWLVLEYVPSRSLGSVLSEYGALHPAHVASIGVQIASGLSAAHAAGIVHRDVKPENILIARSPGQGDALGWPGGMVKLTDFGVSHAATTPALTSTGVLTGTPAYFAPETARGEGTDARSDIYSLGATLYAAVEGRPPFDSGDENVLALLVRIGHGGVPAPRRAGPLTSLLQALTADDPAARPTAEQARYALQQIAAWPQPQSHGVPPSAPTLLDRQTTPAGPPVAGRGPVHGPTAYGPPPHHVSPPNLAPPTPPRRNNRVGVALAALAVLLVAAVVTAVTIVAINASPDPVTPPVASPTSAPPAPTTTAAPNVGAIGDPSTADPCSLVDEAALSQFGTATIDYEYYEFSACSTDIRPEAGGYVIYNVDFQSQAEVSAVPGAESEQAGDLTIIRLPADSERCVRRVRFPDDTFMVIEADLVETIATDLCTIADVGTDVAVRTIMTSGVGTREPLESTRPLAAVNACDLLASNDLAVVPGAAAAEAEPEFGAWGCIWDTADRDVRIDFYRDYPLGPNAGTSSEYAGRPGAYQYSSGRCRAEIVQREYTGVDGQDHVDLVRVFVFGRGDDEAELEDELCGHANSLAEAIAPKLP